MQPMISDTSMSCANGFLMIVDVSFTILLFFKFSQPVYDSIFTPVPKESPAIFEVLILQKNPATGMLEVDVIAYSASCKDGVW